MKAHSVENDADNPDIKTCTTKDGQWQIQTRKSAILKAEPIEEMHKRLGIPIPEMIFGDNYVAIKHMPTGWTLTFNAYDALDLVSKTADGMLQVAYSHEWQRDRQHHHQGIKEVVKPFDWSYSTAFKGTSCPKDTWQPSSTAKIRTDLLARPDPIVFYDEVVLYEDELADNGIAVLSCKVRVMPDRLLVLSRFFLRLDGVIVRLRDTRVYVELHENPVVVRQYTAREESYESLKQKLATRRENVPEALRDPTRVAGLMSVVQDVTDTCTLSEISGY